jgi:putative transposase
MVSKRIKGQKRHLVVDTQGLLLGVAVTEANLQDLLGGVAVLLEECCHSESLQLI